MSSSARKLTQQLGQAENYTQWKAAAIACDEHMGLASWKQVDISRRYDYRSIRSRLDRLCELRERRDDVGLLFTLNEGIHGNIGGMGRPTLYAKTKFGTKQLVNDYVDEIVSALEHLASPAVTDISVVEKLEFFRRASHCFGRSALMLSGSGTLLYFHVGVIKALWQEDQLPTILSGASGGALVSALVGTHTHDELEAIFEPAYLLAEIQREVGIWKSLFGFRPHQLQLGDLNAMLDRLIPDLTFQEAFERTGRHINISVAPAELMQTSRLLNAMTSPNVCIREALLASAALPGFFPPVMLSAKNVRGERQPYLPSRKWVDGSISEDLPAKRLARLYGVNHYIASQTNPLVLPFVTDKKVKEGSLATVRHAAQRTLKEWVEAGAMLMHKPLSSKPQLHKLMHNIASVVRQEYTADINIIPPKRLFNPFKLLALRSEQDVMEMIRAGEQATWPKVEMIRTSTKISKTLDRILADFEQPNTAERDRPGRSLPFCPGSIPSTPPGEWCLAASEWLE